MLSSGNNFTNSPTAPELNNPADETGAWLTARLKIRSDLSLQSRIQGGKPVTLIEDPARNRFFQLGEFEAAVVRKLDGANSMSEIAAAVESDSSRQSNPQQVAHIARWLIQNNLASIAGIDNTQRLIDRSEYQTRQSRFSLANAICFRIPLFDPTRLLDRLAPVGRWCFHSIAVGIWIAVLFAAAACLWYQRDALAEGYVGILAGSKWIWLVGLWIVLKAIHEIAHGVACRRYGGDVPEAGVLLLLFTPLAYVNVTSTWKLASRWQRIVVSFAGMYVELFLAAVAAIAWTQIQHDSLLKDLCFQTFTMAGITTLLFNANPLMRFDGYYILSDALDVPNLYSKGGQWVWERIRFLVMGWPIGREDLDRREKQIVPIYGILSGVWRVLVCISLLIAASVLFHGIGIAIAFSAVFGWYVLPLFKFISKIRSESNSFPIDYRWFGIAIPIAFILILVVFAFISGPTSTSAPAIAQLEQETILRAKSGGFIAEILVADGQTVQQGQLLAKLINPSLQVETAVLAEQRHESEIQSRIQLQAGELAKYQAELERTASLDRQLIEKRTQLDELNVVAPFDGIVLQRDLTNRIGCFVKLGEPIMTLAKSGRIEIVVSIEQNDFPTIAQLESANLKVVFPGVPVAIGTITSSNPKASLSPIHAAMCADRGGPLPVKRNPRPQGDTREDSVTLLTPRFNLRVTVPEDAAAKILSGQQGKVIFPINRHSLGTFCFLAVHNWIERRLNSATSQN